MAYSKSAIAIELAVCIFVVLIVDFIVRLRSVEC